MTGGRRRKDDEMVGEINGDGRVTWKEMKQEQQRFTDAAAFFRRGRLRRGRKVFKDVSLQ